MNTATSIPGLSESHPEMMSPPDAEPPMARTNAFFQGFGLSSNFAANPSLARAGHFS